MLFPFFSKSVRFWGGRGAVLMIMHGRSRMTIDTRIPTTPGRSMPGFADQAGIASNNREAT